MLLYYITDRTQFSGDEPQRRKTLLAKISEAAACGVDFIQIREKDLSAGELESLAKQALGAIHNRQPNRDNTPTRLLINSGSDIALAVGAAGVHLRSRDISVRDARKAGEIVFSRNSKLAGGQWMVAVSCHSEEEVRTAAEQGADFVVFAPVFEKKAGGSSTGLDALRSACRHPVPVLALGGVTLENAQSCLDAGAAGVAGIRLFQDNEISKVVRLIRAA